MSPTLISLVATASFSLTTGTMPFSTNALMVSRALRKRSRSSRSARVSSI
ncbi:Uncharacterised protein [Vibrio cholerae]|nr:Uncharacterised protein [Vibrio cholerae]CSI74552.1 Uncharacterised protein [Vibrio cholerae]